MREIYLLLVMVGCLFGLLLNVACSVGGGAQGVPQPRSSNYAPECDGLPMSQQIPCVEQHRQQRSLYDDNYDKAVYLEGVHCLEGME